MGDIPATHSGCCYYHCGHRLLGQRAWQHFIIRLPPVRPPPPLNRRRKGRTTNKVGPRQKKKDASSTGNRTTTTATTCCVQPSSCRKDNKGRTSSSSNFSVQEVCVCGRGGGALKSTGRDRQRVQCVLAFIYFWEGLKSKSRSSPAAVVVSACCFLLCFASPFGASE